MVLTASFVISIPIILCVLLFLRFYKKQKTTISFFHPNCSSGGGGEMVLWTIIKVLEDSFPNFQIVIFTADKRGKDYILESVKNTFGFDFTSSNIRFVDISVSYSFITKKYPVATLFFQAIASMVCVFHALLQCNAEYYFDTTGYAFTYPFAWVAGAKILTYTHYPTISTDMLSVVENRETAINNNQTIAKSNILSSIKIYYYKIFAFFYYLVGSLADVVFVNGTWTSNHITSLWKKQPKILFPPCDIDAKNPQHKTNHNIISIGQFRPEKNHSLQIEAIRILIEQHPEVRNELRFTVIGGTRDAEDRARKQTIKDLVENYNLSDVVDIPDSTSYDEKIRYLTQAEIGLHTMINEHFGICVVEYMGFGVIPVAHNSGGPQLDIVSEDSGFLASTAEEYANAIYTIITEMRKSAIERSSRFSVQSFSGECKAHLKSVLI
ncbi:GDP-Man:Man(3)GlcNAc(2)-PP-Dol alpha-1 [Entamoeba marina]